MTDDEIIQIWHGDLRGIPMGDAIRRLAREVEIRTVERCAALCEETYLSGSTDLLSCVSAIRSLKSVDMGAEKG